MNRAKRSPKPLRIIGGQWRSRHLEFPELPGLRPTPDRVRETLFNWLAPVLPGARCLDLFAGSGALGIEALSRGAAETVFVEQHPAAVGALRANLAKLQADGAHVHMADAQAWLRLPSTPFDIVFLDPPFGAGLLEPVCARLEQNGWLAEQTWIYLEAEIGQMPVLPAAWTLHRNKTAGAVLFQLAVTRQ